MFQSSSKLHSLEQVVLPYALVFLRTRVNELIGDRSQSAKPTGHPDSVVLGLYCRSLSPQDPIPMNVPNTYVPGQSSQLATRILQNLLLHLFLSASRSLHLSSRYFSIRQPWFSIALSFHYSILLFTCVTIAFCFNTFLISSLLTVWSPPPLS